MEEYVRGGKRNKDVGTKKEIINVGSISLAQFEAPDMDMNVVTSGSNDVRLVVQNI